LTGDGRAPEAMPHLGDGGGEPGDRGGGGRGPRPLCPRCHIYRAIPELFRGKEGPLCAICGTDDILGWDTFGNA
jgi:hypothetical protein